MSKIPAEKKQVYAIVRVDEFHDESVTWANKIKVTKVVFDRLTAQSEVDRLTRINGGKGATYFWQATHIEPSPKLKLI
jgi:hypothetical protein